MAVYYKPQSPIQSGEDFIYPITTADQVKVDKDTRLNAVGVYLKNIDNSTDTTVYGNNATTLGGVAAEDYALKTDTAPDSAKLGGKAPEYYIQPRNLLDNSDFRNPVNQRGKTSYTTIAYCIDRWMLGAGEAQLTASGIKLTGSIFRQPVPLQAGTYTFAVHLTNGTTLFIIFQYDGSSTFTMLGGTNETTEAYINAYNYATGVLIVQFVQEDSSSVAYTLAWAALYEGTYTAETLPPYVPKGYAAELAECDLYYRPLGDNVMSVIGMTSSDGGIILLKSIRPMREGGVPTIVNNGTLYARVNGTDYTVTQVRVHKSDKSGVEIFATASGSPSKQAATIHGSDLLALSRDL